LKFESRLVEIVVWLSERHWLRRNTGLPVRFGMSTIERWSYKDKKAQDPVSILSRQRREDAGLARVFSAQVVMQIHASYQENPFWSVQLQYDNLRACAELESSLGKLPSYSSLKRYLRANSMLKNAGRAPIAPAPENRRLVSMRWRSEVTRRSMCTGCSTWTFIMAHVECLNPMDAG
jgi:hypothetical protein